MAYSASAFEDQTDEDFLDKLVDDDFDGSPPKPEEMSRALSNLSIGDVIAFSEDSGKPEIAAKAENNRKGDALKPDESAPLETSCSFDLDNVGSHDLSTVKSDGSKGTSVKVVQWSAFSVDSSQEFERLSGFEPYSDFPTENYDGFIEKAVEDFSSNVDSAEQKCTQFYGSADEQTANENDPQLWETLYPGWKFDASTGQWYQVDRYDATTDGQLDSSNVASVDPVSESLAVSYVSESSSVSCLHQSSQSVLETIAEECTSSSASNWNKASQGSMEYPPNMVFDPQYSDWYYDTSTEQWHTLESYAQGLENNSKSIQDQTLPGLSSDQNHTLYSNTGQTERHGIQDKGSQESEQACNASTGSYAQQNSLYSNISQSSQHNSQSQGSQDFGPAWDASISNYDQNYSLYNSTSKAEQTASKIRGSQNFAQNWNAPKNNLSKKNSLYSEINASGHHTAQSKGSQDFGQNWGASTSNYAQPNSSYSNISHSEWQTNQGQVKQGFEGNWNTSRSTYSQETMWQPKLVSMNAQTDGFSATHHTGSSFSSVPRSHTTQGTGFTALEPVVNQNYGNKRVVTGFQSFTPMENMHKFSPPKMEQTLQTRLSDSFYGDENTGNAPQKSFEVANASCSQFADTPSDGRSSAGRHPHALVTFGFGGKLIVMKNASLLGAHLDYGSQGSPSSTISVHSLSEVVAGKDDGSSIIGGSCNCYFQALCEPSFPGPLVCGNTATRDVNKWIDEKIGKCESSSIDFQKGEFLKLLFSLLKIMCQHYGKLRSPFGADPSLEEVDGPESSLTKLFASARNKGARLTVLGSLAHCMRNLPSKGQIMNLLVAGRRKEALQYAQESQMWGPALVLAAQLGKNFYVDTVRKMAQCQFVCGSPLQTLCLLIAGQPADVFSVDIPADSSFGSANVPHGSTKVLAKGMLDDWEENLAIITANRTEDDEFVIIHLGDCLLKERGEVCDLSCFLHSQSLKLVISPYILRSLAIWSLNYKSTP